MTSNTSPGTSHLGDPGQVTSRSCSFLSGKEDRHCHLGHKLFREHCSGVYKNAFHLTQIILIYILIALLLILKHQQ